MRRVKITIGSATFDHADYDADNDVLYLHVGKPQEAEGEETPEGHVVRYAPDSQRIVGLTVLGAQRSLDRDGELRVTIPRSVKASAHDLAPALVVGRLELRLKRLRLSGPLATTISGHAGS